MKISTGPAELIKTNTQEPCTDAAEKLEKTQ